MSINSFSFEENKGAKITHHLNKFYFRIIPTLVIESSSHSNKEAIRLNTYSTPDCSGIIIQPGKEVTHVNIKEWSVVIDIFNQWLQWLKEEEDQPDLWAAVENNAKYFTYQDLDAKNSDERFSNTELNYLNRQLASLEQQIATLGLSLDATQELRDSFQEAAVKAETLTKKDWKNHFIGMMISVITSLALDPVKTQSVYILLKNFFSGLFIR